MNINCISIALLALALSTGAQAQQRSEKRGIGWDEKTLAIGSKAIKLMSPGVSWIYNWGATPKNEPAELAEGGEMLFMPMAWNGNFDETKLRQYLDTHPSVKRLLGFNEPNFSAQANMTPKAAATAWKKLEAIAADYNLELVAPALNFTGEKVGGRTWAPYEWYEAFFEAYPDAKVDYLALHCYMNWAENVDWFASRYFYSDTDDNLFSAATKAKYPHLVSYLTNYKEQHGHYPKMYLTEFCSWEYNVYPYNLTRDFQIDQITQKLQYLEKSDLVAGYAWFMANTSKGENEAPYMSVLQSNTADSELSELGKVYVYMSSFDTEKYYTPGETILAKDYVDATLNDHQVKLRPSTDADSEAPLQLEIPSSGSATWQVYVPVSDTYSIKLRLKSTADTPLLIYVDGKRTSNETLLSTAGAWGEAEASVKLSAGNHTLLVYNFGDESILLSELRLGQTTGITTTTTDSATRYYRPDGVEVDQDAKGLVIEVKADANGRKQATKVVK